MKQIPVYLLLIGVLALNAQAEEKHNDEHDHAHGKPEAVHDDHDAPGGHDEHEEEAIQLSPEVLHFLLVNKAEAMDFIHERLNRGCKSVTVVEMTGKAGQDIGLSTRWTVLAELRRLGVTIMTNTRAVAITDEGLEIEKGEKREVIEADSVVLAVGSTAENSLANEIKDLVKELHVIGDAKQPRNALDAIREGLMVGLKV